MKDKSDNAAFLQKSYGTNGAGLIIQGQEYAVWYDPEGIRISPGHTVQKLHTTIVTWEQAAKRIRELLDMGRYMPQAELDQVPDFERRRLAQALAFAVRECSAQAKEAGYLPLTTEIDSSNSGFPEIEAQMQRLLESPDTLTRLAEEWAVFASAHANDRSLMVSRLPERNGNADAVVHYLKSRGIHDVIIRYCLENDLLFESRKYHSAVFLGYDKEGVSG